jgi:hypothetical protein
MQVVVDYFAEALGCQVSGVEFPAPCLEANILRKVQIEFSYDDAVMRR